MPSARWDNYAATISEDEWFHAVFVFDGSGGTNADRAKIYVNGLQRSLTFSANPIPATTADFTGVDFDIGRSEGSAGMLGLIDDLRLYMTVRSRPRKSPISIMTRKAARTLRVSAGI